MNKIKEYRKQSHMTQKQLATQLHTTQQTIARWEKGDPEPSLANLRDLAYVLKTTVGALLADPWTSHQSSNYHLMLKENENGLDGFWGNLGILPAGREKSTWYPITVGTFENIALLVEHTEPFQFETLNNKLVLVNPNHVKRYATLDEAADAFPDDWELEWHEFGYESLEIYDALEAYYEELWYPNAEKKLSENLRGIVKELVRAHNLDENRILELTSGIRIFFNDGAIEKHTLTNFDFIDHMMFSICSSDEFPETITIEDDDYSMYIPTDSISLIEFPLLKANEVMKRMNSDDD